MHTPWGKCAMTACRRSHSFAEVAGDFVMDIMRATEIGGKQRCPCPV
jgi:hypothetical protein